MDAYLIMELYRNNPNIPQTQSHTHSDNQKKRIRTNRWICGDVCTRDEGLMVY